MSTDGNAVLAHVARLHYVRDLSKQEIGERLGLSRFKVARLLEQAREQGVVRFEIADPVAVDEALSGAVERAYGLRQALVAPEPARAAAAWLPALALPGRPLGVAWGATLQEVAAALPAAPDPGGPGVVQVCGVVAGLRPGTGPAELALRFAEKLGGPLWALPAPALAGPAARDELLADDAVRPTVEQFGRVGTVLAGVGTALPGAPPEAAGHLLVHAFDAGGALLPAPAEREAIAMSREQLMGARLVAVAAGEAKRVAIRGALRSGLVDTLVTDPATAATLAEDA
jgi:DNA-binding transcriptional regulator LsrR (DeoR family)